MNEGEDSVAVRERLRAVLDPVDPTPGFVARVQVSLRDHASAPRYPRVRPRFAAALVSAAVVIAFGLALGLGFGLRSHVQAPAGHGPHKQQTGAPTPGAVSTATPNPATPAPGSSGLANVVACPTTYGVQPPAGGRSLPPVPATIPVTSAPPTGQVSWYAGAAAFPVLAPAGWSCSALVAADGGQSTEAYPAGSSASAPEELVSAYGNFGGCTGCVYQDICGLFSVPSQIPATSCAPTAGRSVTRVDSTTVLYQDPPGSPMDHAIVALGDPDPIMGVVVYDPAKDGDTTAWTATCVMPASSAADCRYVLLQFAAWALAQPL